MVVIHATVHQLQVILQLLYHLVQMNKNNKETLTTYGALLNRIYEFSSYRGPQFGRSIGRTSSSLGNNNINKGNAHQVLSGIGSATSIKSSLYNGYISNTVIDLLRLHSSNILFLKFMTVYKLV